MAILTDVSYDDGTWATADIHLPAADAEDAPLVVNIHGGGWYTGDKALATRCSSALAERGLVVMNANYSIPPHDPVPAMVGSVFSALRWVRSRSGVPSEVRAASAGGVVVTGDSAGAHVAVLACSATRDPRLADLLGVETRGIPPILGWVSWCGALSLDDLVVAESNPLRERFSAYIRAMTDGRRVAARLAELDPVRWMGEAMPPGLIATSSADFFCSSGQRYAAAAQRRGLPVELMYYGAEHPACVHSWQLDPELAESQEVYDRTAQFVRARGPVVESVAAAFRPGRALPRG